MTKPKNETPLALICHPFLFALKEGMGISQNLMDYNLLLLQRNCSECLRSPIFERIDRKKTIMTKTIKRRSKKSI